MAAQSLHRSKSALGEFFRKKKAYLSVPQAVTAAAHKMARIIYAMLKTKTPYVDMGPEYYNAQHKARQLKKLERQAKEQGYGLAPLPSM